MLRLHDGYNTCWRLHDGYIDVQVRPDAACYNVLLAAYAKNGAVDHALHILQAAVTPRGGYAA